MAIKLFRDRTTDGVSDSVSPFALSQNKATYAGNMTIQANIAGTGAVSATVTLEGSNGLGWSVIKTLSLTGTDDDIKHDTVQGQPWAMVRAQIASISGTGATVNVALNC